MSFNVLKDNNINKGNSAVLNRSADGCSLSPPVRPETLSSFTGI